MNKSEGGGLGEKWNLVHLKSTFSTSLRWTCLLLIAESQNGNALKNSSLQ